MKLKTTIGMVLLAAFALAFTVQADGATPEEKGFEIAARADRSDLGFGDSEVVMIDDVLQTGRSVRAALNAILVYGRTRHTKLLVLVDRGDVRCVHGWCPRAPKLVRTCPDSGRSLCPGP